MIISIDAGFNAFGWALFSDRGEYVKSGWYEYKKPKDKKHKVRASDLLVEQSQAVYRELSRLVVEHKATAMVVELPSGGAISASAMRAMGMASCMLACLAEVTKIPVEWVPPDQVKIAMTGRKDASKDDIIKAALGKYMQFHKDIQWISYKGSTRPHSNTEHAADAVGAFEAARNGQMVRMITKLAAPNSDKGSDLQLF